MTLVEEKMMIIESLYGIGAIKFGDFTLKTGIHSPIYIDLRLIISYPSLLKEISEAFFLKSNTLSYDLICGVPYTALPIATTIAINNNIPMIMKRKEKKDYGTKKVIEGVYKRGQKCLLIEDLITSGESLKETIEPLEDEGLMVQDILILIDREQGGKKRLEERGYRVHSLFALSEILNTLEHQNKISSSVVLSTKEFIQANQVFYEDDL